MLGFPNKKDESIVYRHPPVLPKAEIFPPMIKVEAPKKKVKIDKDLIGSIIETIEGFYEVRDVLWSELNQSYIFDSFDLLNNGDIEMIKEEEVIAYYIKNTVE